MGSKDRAKERLMNDKKALESQPLILEAIEAARDNQIIKDANNGVSVTEAMQIQRLAQELALTQQQLTEAQASNANWRYQVEKLMADVESQKEEAARWKRESTRLKANHQVMLDQTANKMDQLIEENRGLKSEVHRYQSNSNRYEKRMDYYKAQLDALESGIE